MATKAVGELRRGDQIVLTDIETGRRSRGTITYVGERPNETVQPRKGGARAVAWAVFYRFDTGGEAGQLFSKDDRLELI